MTLNWYAIVGLVIILFIAIGLLLLKFKKFRVSYSDSEEDYAEDLHKYKKEKMRRILDQDERLRDYRTEVPIKIISVGFHKAYGPFSQKLLNEKMGYIVALKQMLGGKLNTKGFWQLMVKAQSMARGAGRGQSRGAGDSPTSQRKNK